MANGQPAFRLGSLLGLMLGELWEDERDEPDVATAEVSALPKAHTVHAPSYDSPMSTQPLVQCSYCHPCTIHGAGTLHEGCQRWARGR